MQRRRVLPVLAGLPLALPAGPGRAEAGADTLLWLGFELLDEQPDPAREAEHAARLAAAGRQLGEGLQALGLYTLADAAPARPRIAQVRAQTEFLYRCNGCLGALGEAAGARLVAVGWVQRVSNLILNLNLEIRRADDDRMVLTKSVDIRGDNDESWRRGVAYMLRDMAERRARQPGYGL